MKTESHWPPRNPTSTGLNLGRAPGFVAGVGMMLAATNVPSRAELGFRLQGGGRAESMLVSNLCLHVAPGGVPSAFVPPGPFRGEWSGALDVELRGDFRFRVQGTGNFRLELNGVPVPLPDASPQAAGAEFWSGPVRLRKGRNPLKATFEGDSVRGAGMQLWWQGRSVPAGPIPDASLVPDPESDDADRALMTAARRGRATFLEFRCGRCHGTGAPDADSAWAHEGPSFSGIGDRRFFGWLAKWIEDPRSIRADATMPSLLHGPAAGDEARAIAAWLMSLRSEPAAAVESIPGNASAGRALFGSLLCDSCHSPPGGPEEAAKISLTRVAEKFPPTILPVFLRRPSEHHLWTRMPDFHLTDVESANLAAWLLSASTGKPDLAFGPADVAAIGRGKRLAEERGCLACHAGPATNRLVSPPLAELVPAHWSRGCLVEDPLASGKLAQQPRYDFERGTRADLRALAALDRHAVVRRVPAESAARWLESFRCNGCHEAREGIPKLASVGDKLRPEWMSRLLHGDEPRKARPWLPARMPSFPAYAFEFAEGLASLRGRGAAGSDSTAVDSSAAEIGRRMVSASGGFACVTCHAVGSLGATAVFEAPGVNFARVSERLLPDFFGRWVRNPQAIEPGTKMPLYFDEDGNSTLTDFYGGDGPKTIRALWEYLRQGERIVPPAP